MLHAGSQTFDRSIRDRSCISLVVVRRRRIPVKMGKKVKHEYRYDAFVLLGVRGGIGQPFLTIFRI